MKPTCFARKIELTGWLFRYLPVLGIVVFGLALFSSCREQSSSERERSPMKVEVILAKPSPLSVLVTSTGDLLPNEQVEIKSPVSGNVMSIHFKEGQFVQEGDLLVKIDDRTWRARLGGLEAKLASSKSELKRKANLLKIEGASEEDVDQARAAVEDLQSQVNEIRVMIDLASVKAPFSGQLGMRDFSLGAYLNQGVTITTLAQTNPLKVDFTIPAKYASKIRKEMQVNIGTNDREKISVATIYAIDPVVSSSTRSLRARALMPNPGQEFISGDFVQVSVKIEQTSEALLIPSESVIPELNTHVVYKVKQGKAAKTDVTIGTRTESEIQITSGLETGDTVIVTGLLEINDGDKVEVGEIKEKGAL